MAWFSKQHYIEQCGACDGKGQLEVLPPYSSQEHYKRCTMCKGKGHVRYGFLSKRWWEDLANNH